MTAQGMSAGTAETQSGSGLQPASPVGNADAPNLNHTIPGGSMSQVTEAMWLAGKAVFNSPARYASDREHVTAIYLAMSSASPPVEQSPCKACDGQGGTDGHDQNGEPTHSKVTCAKCGGTGDEQSEGVAGVWPNCSFDEYPCTLTPPPVTVSVEEVADTVMRAVADPGKFVPGFGSDYPSLTHWQHAAVIAALKEGHSLSTVNGVVR